MKVILYMAMSVNGIIARENNEEDFLSHDNWNTFLQLANQTGCMIWGRKTHEIVKKWEKEYWDEIKNIRKVIISRNPNLKLEEGCLLANSPQDALEKLTKEGFESVILTGGATLNTSFVKAGLIDEVILNVESIAVGKGIPLFSPQDFDLKLQLLGLKKISESIVHLRYKVIK